MQWHSNPPRTRGELEVRARDAIRAVSKAPIWRAQEVQVLCHL